MAKDKTAENYVKLMKAMARIAKRRNVKLMTERVSNEIFGEIVYLTDSCAVYPIPASIYDANAEACKCPTEEYNVELYKIIRDTDDKGRRVIPTRMLWELTSCDKVVRVYKSDTDYLFANVEYTDLIELLPDCLRGYSECKNEKDVYPIVFYNSDVDLGYAICPISTRARNQGSDFENCVHAIEAVSYADVE